MLNYINMLYMWFVVYGCCIQNPQCGIVEKIEVQKSRGSRYLFVNFTYDITITITVITLSLI